MKTSDKLYNINRQISLRWIGLNEKPNMDEIMKLNEILGEVIKEIRDFYDK